MKPALTFVNEEINLFSSRFTNVTHLWQLKKKRDKRTLCRWKDETYLVCKFKLKLSTAILLDVLIALLHSSNVICLPSEGTPLYAA